MNEKALLKFHVVVLGLRQSRETAFGSAFAGMALPAWQPASALASLASASINLRDSGSQAVEG